MPKPVQSLVLAQVITLSRVGASLLFATIAFAPSLRLFAIGLFAYALVVDIFDGQFARHYQVTSAIGATLDGFSDKFQTIVAVLYLTALGFSPAACALLVLRDLLTASLRAIRVDDIQLIPANRWIGGLSGVPIKVVTLILLIAPKIVGRYRTPIQISIWIFAIVTSSVLLRSLWIERERIWRALNEEI
jgi:phosphatidylglycerophosphate synthase